MSITKWHEDRRNLYELADWLETQAYWLTTDALIKFIEKPWKWTPEWELYQLWQKQECEQRKQDCIDAVTEEISAETLQARWEESGHVTSH